MRSSRWIALALVGALWLAPASAHVDGVKHTWKKHFRKLATKLFYTKAQSDVRFLDLGEADARFVNSDEKVQQVLSLPADRLDVAFASATGPTPTTVSIAPALSFDADTNETIYFSFRVPTDWDGASSLRVSILWRSESTSGNVVWTVFQRAYRVGSNLQGLAVGSSAAVPPSTESGAIVELALASIEPGPLEPDHIVALGLRRSGAAVADTVATHAHLMEVRISYTALR